MTPPPRSRRTDLVTHTLAILVVGVGSRAWAVEPISPRLASLRLAGPAGITQPDEAADADPHEFGEAGTWWWSVGGGFAAGDKTTNGNTNINFGLHTFLVDRFELGLEFGGWFFNQDNQDDALAANFNLQFRWHFISRKRMSVFAEAGAGVIGATDEVPNTGSEFNFTPRAGMGVTWRLGQGPARLVVGGRWQHISNARTAGTDRNPGTDNGMAYVSVMWPF